MALKLKKKSFKLHEGTILKSAETFSHGNYRKLYIKIVYRVAIMGTCTLPWLEISDQSFS